MMIHSQGKINLKRKKEKFLKRKKPESSSKYEPDDVLDIVTLAIKKSGLKKTPATIPSAPIDNNISFHSEECVLKNGCIPKKNSQRKSTEPRSP
jgi:hypothetical protein